MLTRREFFGVSSVALAGTACQTGLAEGEASLPTSIAALTSMRDQASPITVDERRGRIEKARRLMGQNSLGALMLTGSP
jgi:Xaa-Pro dipeptidase